MAEFFHQNWLALLSFVVALIGGVPGILGAVTYFKNRPMFRFMTSGVITGQANSSGILRTMILISGTVSNEGTAPLSPASFDLKVLIDGKWLDFQKTLIPPNAKFRGNVQRIDISSADKNDLQRFNGTISYGVPLNGHLMFLSDRVSLEKLNSDLGGLHLKLSCMDIFGKKYWSDIKPGSPIAGPDIQIFPKQGITVKTLQKNRSKSIRP